MCVCVCVCVYIKKTLTFDLIVTQAAATNLEQCYLYRIW